MGQSLDNVYQGALDQKEVDTLVKQVADEHNLDIGKEITTAGTSKPVAQKQGKGELDSMQDRLNNLKQ